MVRLIRAAVVLGILAAASPVAASDSPTLGGRLSPFPLVWERDAPVVNVTNLSTIPVRVTVEADGGWRVDSASFTLAVNERRSVSITAAGSADGRIRARLDPADAIPGVEAVGLVLETRARHATFVELYPAAPAALLAAVTILLLALVRRKVVRR
ncbi:MAG: hypothetical protein HYX57_01995 [Chloroflexi bacterium]|nr:hypothetical protein [Chloroflexota bacterium]